MHPRTLSLIVPIVAVTASLSAQNQVWTPQQIVYKGAFQYQPPDLNSLAALKLGGQVGKADVDRALQNLADTGLFADIRYTIDNRAVIFTLTPQPDSVMLRAVYSNFVMFDSGQLPGEQFHLASVKTVNLTPEQQKEFDSAFRLHPGDPYDEGYVATFLKRNTALRSFTGYSATYRQAAHLDTHTVELTMTFVKGGSLTR